MSDHKTTLAVEIRLNNTLKKLIAVLIVLLVMMSIVALKNAGTSTAVLVPYSALAAKSNIVVKGDIDEDVEYLKRLLLSDLQLFANFTPETIDRNIGVLQFRLMPDAWAKFSDEISSDVEFMKKSRISQVFYPIRTEYVPGRRIFRVIGDVVRFSGDQVLSRVSYVYDVKYVMSSPFDYRISALKGSTFDKASKVPDVTKSGSGKEEKESK